MKGGAIRALNSVCVLLRVSVVAMVFKIYASPLGGSSRITEYIPTRGTDSRDQAAKMTDTIETITQKRSIGAFYFPLTSTRLNCFDITKAENKLEAK